MWRIGYLLFTLLFFISYSVLAEDLPAEKLKPKRELTEGQKKEAQELKSKIAEELKRLTGVRGPLDTAEKELAGPQKELDDITEVLGKISGLVNDNEKVKPGSKEAKDVEAKIIEEAKKIPGAGPYAKTVITHFDELLKFNEAKAAKKDTKKLGEKLDLASGKMVKAQEKIDGRLRKTVEKLDEKRNIEKKKFEKEQTTLLTYRAKLRSIYGYEVEDAAILFTGGGDTDANITAWLDEQGRFIEKLSAYGYDDLATEYFNRIRKTNNPYTGRALSDNAANYMNKIGAKLRLQKALYVDDLVQKLVLGQEALDILETVVKRLIPNSPSHMDATIELLAAKFSLAESVTAAAWKVSILDGGFPYLEKTPSLDPDAEEPAEAAPEKAKSDKKDSKAGKDGKAPKDSKDSKADKASKDSKVSAAGGITEEALSKLSKEQLMVKSVEWADKQYSTGVLSGLALHDKISEIFMDMLDGYMAARDAGNKASEQKFYRLLNSFSPKKIRNQHGLEKAFAGWPQLFKPGAEARTVIGSRGNEYVLAVLDDYRQIWPNDKLVYSSWIDINGGMNEPVLQSEGGKPLPHFNKPPEDEWKELSKEDKQFETRNLERYPWASDRVEGIFNWYIVSLRSGEAVKDPQIQSGRERAYYSYAEAMANLTVNTYKRALAAKDDDRAKLLFWADKLAVKADKALAGFANNKTPVGPLSDMIRERGQSMVSLVYYLSMADIQLKAGNKEKAAAYSTSALSAVAAVKASSVGYYYKVATDGVVLVGDFEKKNGIQSSDDPAQWNPALLATTAEDALLKAVRAEQDSKAEEALSNYRKAYELYAIMLDKYRGLKGKDDRERLLVKPLYNFAVAAAKLKDYLPAIIANQALVQEFRNDFDDPARNYPPQKYENVARYFDKSLINLKAAADKQRAMTNSARDKRLFIDAMLMNVRTTKNGQDYVVLVNQFSDQEEYESAVEFIDNVPENNDYYRIIQLMASSIYLKIIGNDVAQIKDIDARLNPEKDEDGNIPDALKISEKERKELLARKAELRKAIDDYSKQAEKYAQKFIRLHEEALKKWAEEKKLGIVVTDQVLDIRKQEKANLLKAMLIPIMMDYEAQKWDAVIKQVPEYYASVEKQAGIDAKEKNDYLMKASWFLFIAQFSKADYKNDDLKQAIANLKKAETALEGVAKYDKDQTLVSNGAAALGSAWLQLAGRSEKEGQKDLTRQLSLSAVNWLDKAERRIYENVALGITMGATLTEQKLYDRAENTLQKVIYFWSESLFTPMSLYQEGKSEADLGAMAPEISDNLSKAFDSGKISAAKGDAAKLVEVLNKMILETKFEDYAEGYNKAIAAALKSGKDRKLKSALEQAEKIALAFAAPSEDAQKLLKLRPYLKNKPSTDQRNRLNRIMLETAYPEVLYRQSVTPMIPSPAVTLQQTYVISRAYRSEAGRKKAAVLMAIFDPWSVRDSSYGPVVFGSKEQKGKGGFVGELTAMISSTKEAGKKELYEEILRALENPLVVSLYGVPDDRGRLENRNYFLALKTIETIMLYDKAFPTSEKLPVAEYLKDLQKALSFQNVILYAKKNYAKAMVENGQYVKAEKYVRELSILFPADWTLTLDLGRIYTEMAKFEVGKEGIKSRKPRAFSEKAAGDYLLGVMQINNVLRIAQPGTEPYWQARLLVLENGISSLEARSKASAALKGEFKVSIDYFNQATGTSRKIEQNIAPFDKAGRELVINTLRTMEMVNPRPSKKIMSDLSKMLERLEKLGFKKPKEAKLEDI